MDSRQMWTEVSEVFLSEQSLRQKYTLLYGLLDRVCIELTTGLNAHYNSLFTRLQVLCRMHEYPLTAVDTMRWRARQVKQGAYEPDEAEFLQDVKALSDALCRFTDSRLPLKLRRALPDRVMPSAVRPARNRKQKRQRFVAVSRDERFIYARTADDPSVDLLRIDFTLNEHTQQTAAYVEADMAFNCVAFTVDKDDIYYPTILVLEPDYLIDVSALTACVRPYGSSPFNYLLKKFTDKPESRAILLGHVANQMLDDCVNDADASYENSVQRAFRDHLLDFCTAEGINAQFFAECRQQFDHIKQTVQSLNLSEGGAQLEPSFFCETLGLQGRFDLLANDFTKLLELKSGKWNEARRSVQREHLLQMLLYKEILYYNLDVRQNQCAGYLFYSKYPYLLEQRSAQQMVQEVLTLRNRIVVLERWLCAGRGREFLSKLTSDLLWQDKTLNQSYWERYFRPEIDAILHALHTADDLTKDYFYTFLQFIEREHMLAKVGDSRIESTRGMASLWNADADLKHENGDLLIGLRLKDQRREQHLITSLCFAFDASQDSQPSFRAGDAVVLYQRDQATDNVTNRQVLRATVEHIAPDTVWLQLRTPLRASTFDSQHPTFHTYMALEHDHVESSFRSLYSGLFAMLTTTPSRRALLLCQRQPTADDFQLIVGPPGTGKTSVTLRRMVETMHGEEKRLLLTAYTNRAVDEICEMTEQTGIPYLRIGKPLSCDEKYRHRLLVNVTQNFNKRSEIIDILQNTPIIIGTVSSLTSHLNIFDLLQFDVLIIDEASQILEPQLLPLLCRHQGKFVMIGDHKQLPAVVLQSAQQTEVQTPALRAIGLANCRNSLFQRLCQWATATGCTDLLCFLNRQGRMHPCISTFASRQFYGGRLDIVPLPHQQADLPYLLYAPEERIVATRRVAFFDVPSPSLSERQPKMNEAEAQQVARIAQMLQHLHHENNLPFVPSRQVGIIVPFRRQIAAVRRALLQAGIDDASQMVIDTVERYQGSQRDIILYATTVSQPYELDLLSDIVKMDDGTSVDRKLNVAVTRARQQFFLVGSRRLLMQNPLYASLIHYLEA
ncbi:MAG: AAA domain-containing protein [Bacteroidales bacterium]|nr:AAA domain-containing protein [Bacteroidales bacterium]